MPPDSQRDAVPHWIQFGAQRSCSQKLHVGYSHSLPLPFVLSAGHGHVYVVYQYFNNTLVHGYRLDQNYVIKVADFGLSERTYTKDYFRQKQTTGVKLPMKWMAYESLTDGIFSEKTDVVSLVP